MRDIELKKNGRVVGSVMVDLVNVRIKTHIYNHKYSKGQRKQVQEMFDMRLAKQWPEGFVLLSVVREENAKPAGVCDTYVLIREDDFVSDIHLDRIVLENGIPALVF